MVRVFYVSYLWALCVRRVAIDRIVYIYILLGIYIIRYILAVGERHICVNRIIMSNYGIVLVFGSGRGGTVNNCDSHIIGITSLLSIMYFIVSCTSINNIVPHDSQWHSPRFKIRFTRMWRWLRHTRRV